ncbi:MAG: thioredoxin domain-containing protein [Leptolyngbyaceae cyanobacterium SM1_4_3]|nr:thioredoxin domain-containing protein [Leptolyngbyaceae cyanobacterium SM1_4_3]NJN91693.1 thioredoxin domain-containing protein [Leptolyngbyaceae cyanobacterium SL_5_14]
MPNRLAQAQSLYLRKHAENPINWWSWDDEALETAKRENKPIFLSIGYSSCHWCTVMEGEAFSDEAIAAYMNANFLPIKVDREERPDLDSIYMQALQMMVGQGGWPLNIFLTPSDRIPFYGGTYFPLEAKYGRPGFLQVLQAIRRFYDSETEKVESVKAEILANLQSAAVQSAAGELGNALLRQGLEYSAGILSSRGMGNSFPMIPYAEAALRGVRFDFADSRYDAAAACQQRGLDLALGGIFDHVAGGFHRYTVDSTWTVPHFEKMLYDNGQIVEYLANLWSSGFEEPAFERAIAQTVEWLKREMTAAQGYFYAAQDADSFITPSDVEPEEGAFYVWRYQDLSELLTETELTELAQQFTVTADGNFEGQNVLQRRHPGQLSDTTELILKKLFAVRYGALPETVITFLPAQNNQEAKSQNWAGRIPPVTDTKMIVAWNSLMISGLARAAAVLQQPDYLELASKAADFILKYQWVGDRFQRLNYNGKPAVLAQSEDYALFIKALLDLDQATQAFPNFQPSFPYLSPTVNLQTEFDNFLWSIELGGYYNTDASSDLVVRERSFDDNATPSANGVAIANLIRLALRTENLQYLDRAEQALQAFGGVMKRSPQACPTLFSALDWYRNHTLVRTTAEQVAALIRRYSPTVVYKIESNLPQQAVGLVCQGLSCKEPALNETQLQQQVFQSQVREG